MLLHRISIPKRAEDLSGTGAKLYGGRWNSVGNPMVYTAQSVSLAMLEKLVHSDKSMLRLEYSLTIIEIKEELPFREIDTAKLAEDWSSFPFRHSTVQQGDEWLQKGESAILKVPSAVNPYEYNFLLNPAHPDFREVKIKAIRPLNFDLRFSEIL